MSRKESRVVRKRQDLLSDRPHQFMEIPARQVGAADRGLKDHIPYEGKPRAERVEYYMARRMPRGKPDLQLLRANGYRVSGDEREVYWRKRRSEREPEHCGTLLRVIIDRLIQGMEEDGGFGEPSNRWNPLDVIDVGVGQIDRSNRPSGIREQRDHFGSGSAWINHHDLVSLRAPDEISVLAKRPAGESVDLEKLQWIRIEGLKRQTVNELPHPQPPVAAGLLKVNPEPIMLVT